MGKWDSIEMSVFICTRHVAVKLNMAPDTELSGQTSTVTTISQDSEFNQELSFKDIHFNRFEVGLLSTFDVQFFLIYIYLPQIMSLQFKILIDDKIIGEVSKDISKIDSTDFSEPVSIVLHVSPATQKVNIIAHVFLISPEIFL